MVASDFLFLRINKVFRIGDKIRLSNQNTIIEGIVDDINFAYTTIKIKDSSKVILFNSVITGMAIQNISNKNIKRV